MLCKCYLVIIITSLLYYKERNFNGPHSMSAEWMSGGMRHHLSIPGSDVCQSKDALESRSVLPDYYQTDFSTRSIQSLPIPKSQHPGSSKDKNEAALPQCPCFTLEIHTLFDVRWWRWEATFCKTLILIHLPGAGTGCTKLPFLFSPVMDGVQIARSGLAMVVSL